MGSSPDMITVLDRMDALLAQLREEPWKEYDPVVREACTRMARTSFEELRKVAKAIARVTPRETRLDSLRGEPWYNSTLDDMR